LSKKTKFVEKLSKFLLMRTNISNYQVIKVIGKGGMGTVYLAIHQQIGRKVAIKELNQVFLKDLALQQRFRNEAKLLSQLEHRNIVKLYEYIENSEGAFLIMEYVEGIPLDQYIENISGPIPELRAIEIFNKVLDAFEYAHQHNIIHRDVKPANIMLTQNEDVKILDFGIAKGVETKPLGITQEGLRVGTLLYMSPEQIRAQTLDHRSDIYSLGVTLFEILTGKCPYSMELSEFDISVKIVQEPLPRVKNFYPGISDYLQEVIDKATSKNIWDRYQSASEFKRVLQLSSWKNNPVIPTINSEPQKEWSFDSQEEKKETNTPLFLPTKEDDSYEVALFKNRFGKITNQKIIVYKDKDLFDKGKMVTIELEKTAQVLLKEHREWMSAAIVSGASLLLYYFDLHWIVQIVAVVGVVTGIFLLAAQPIIVIEKTNSKKVKMRDWSWHFNEANKFVNYLKKILKTKV